MLKKNYKGFFVRGKVKELYVECMKKGARETLAIAEM